MLGKPEIRFCDELPVEPLLASAGLVARHEHNGSPFRIEGEGSTPFAVSRLEKKFIHVGVF